MTIGTLASLGLPTKLSSVKVHRALALNVPKAAGAGANPLKLDLCKKHPGN